MQALRLTTAALALITGIAHAGRPLNTEDAAILEPQACELEAGLGQQRSRDHRGHSSNLQLGCGIGLDSQLALRAVQSREMNGRVQELEVNGKWQLASGALSDGAIELALAARLTGQRLSAAVGNPSGPPGEPSGWQPGSHAATLALSAPLLRQWTLHANLGHAQDRLARQHSTLWALALEHGGLDAAGPVQPMAEVFGDDRGAVTVSAALRWAVRPHSVFLDAAWGRQVHRHGGRAGHLATLGFKWVR